MQILLIAKMLLEAGSKAIDQPDASGNTPWSLSKQLGDKDMLRLFQEYKHIEK